MKTPRIICAIGKGIANLLTLEAPQSIRMAYQPKINFTGGMYGSYITPLNNLLEVGNRLKSAEEITSRKYGNKVQIEINLNSSCDTEHKPTFVVDIREKKKGILEYALEDFLSVAGLPAAHTLGIGVYANSSKDLIRKATMRHITPATF